MASILEKIENKRPVLVCPHCGNRVSHQAVYAHSYTYTIPDAIKFDGEWDNVDVEAYYFLLVCDTCSEVSLYSNWIEAENPFDLLEVALVYPKPRKISDIVPKRIANAYQEASRISKIAPNAFACMIRRALEFMCEDKRAAGRTLHEKLKDLSAKNIIPPVLAEMAEIVKKLGNIGAHADEMDVRRDDVDVIDDFFNAVMEYVYLAPEKVSKIKNKLAKKP